MRHFPYIFEYSKNIDQFSNIEWTSIFSFHIIVFVSLYRHFSIFDDVSYPSNNSFILFNWAVLLFAKCFEFYKMFWILQNVLNKITGCEWGGFWIDFVSFLQKNCSSKLYRLQYKYSLDFHQRKKNVSVQTLNSNGLQLAEVWI